MINSQECGSPFGTKFHFDRFNFLFYWRLTKMVLRHQQKKKIIISFSLKILVYSKTLYPP